MKKLMFALFIVFALAAVTTATVSPEVQQAGPGGGVKP